MSDDIVSLDRRAYRQAARQTDDALCSLLAARREFLDAGFGIDHPACLVLDDLAATTRRVLDNQRAAFAYWTTG